MSLKPLCLHVFQLVYIHNNNITVTLDTKDLIWSLIFPCLQLNLLVGASRFFFNNLDKTQAFLPASGLLVHGNVSSTGVQHLL